MRAWPLAVFLSLGFLSEAHSVPPISGILSEAAGALRAGNSSRALDLLKSVSSEDPNYPLSLLEGARLEYRAGRWPEFFGLTGYLRSVFPQSPYASKARVLESLGLIRHCHYSAALRRMDEKGSTEVSEQWKHAHETISHWLLALPKSKLPKAKGRDKITDTAWFPREVVWPVRFDGEMGQFDPYALRRPVESQCEHEGEEK
jgi:hypothetical protein